MNVELIEMIARGRGKTQRKDPRIQAASPTQFNSTPRNNNLDKSQNLNSSEVSVQPNPATQQPKPDDKLKQSNANLESEKEEEDYLNKILTDNTYMLEENKEAKLLRRQNTMLSQLSEFNTKEHEEAETEQYDKMRDLERTRQESIYNLFHQIILDKLMRKSDASRVIDIEEHNEELVDLKLASIRGFKTLQQLRIPPKSLSDHAPLEDMLKSRMKRDYQELRYKNLSGKAKSEFTSSLPPISITNPTPLPQSRLMDLDRRNKLISTHQTLIIQIKQAKKYLISSKQKLHTLKDTHMKLCEGYRIKKEQLVEEIKKYNKKIKKVATQKYNIMKNEEKEKEQAYESLKDLQQDPKDGQRVTTDNNHPQSLENVGGKHPVQQDDMQNSRPSIHQFVTEDSEDAELEEMITKSYVRKSSVSRNPIVGLNNENTITLLLGDLRRSKMMKQKELQDLVEHEKENLGIKKDYLDSLAKYVVTLEDSLTKTERKLRNMYLFLLEHPRDIR